MRRERKGLLFALLLSVLLFGCDDNSPNVEGGLRDLSPNAIVAKVRTLKMPAAIRNYWPAPDGSHMVVQTANDTFSIVDLAHGDEISSLTISLPANMQAVQLDWAADSSAFAYSFAAADHQPATTIIIYTVATGSSVEVKQAGITKMTSPAWGSPTATLYFLADKDGQQWVMSTGRDGKIITTLFVPNDKANERADYLRPTPEGKQFVYNLRNTASSIPKGGIYIADASGHNRSLLTQEPSVSALHIAPQGDRVLVEQSRGTYVVTATFSSILWFNQTRAGDRKLLLPFPKAMTNTPPEVLSGATTLGATWSSAGDKILYITHNYAATAEPPRSIWVVNADGGDPAEIYTSTQETDLNLPEGQTLVWAANNAVVTTNMSDTFTIIQLDKKQ